MTPLLPLLAAILPFALWPIELLLPYPHIVEEVAKAALVYLILKSELKNSNKFKIAVVSGLLFALSETVLYFFNIQLVGGFDTLLKRFIFTLPMHTLNMVIMVALGLWRRWLLILGVVIAAFLHLSFNTISL